MTGIPCPSNDLKPWCNTWPTNHIPAFAGNLQVTGYSTVRFRNLKGPASSHHFRMRCHRLVQLSMSCSFLGSLIIMCKFECYLCSLLSMYFPEELWNERSRKRLPLLLWCMFAHQKQEEEEYATPYYDCSSDDCILHETWSYEQPNVQCVVFAIVRGRVCNSILRGLPRRNFKCVVDDAQPLFFHPISGRYACPTEHMRARAFLKLNLFTRT